MKIQEGTFKNFGSRQNIQIFEDKVAYQYWNPWYEFNDEYNYKDLRPKIAKEKTGDDMWAGPVGYLAGAFLLWIFFLFAFDATVIPKGIGRETHEVCFRIAAGVGLGLISLAIASLILSLVRYEFFIFVTKTDYTAIRIKCSKRNKALAEKISECILDKIKKAN
jgi:hypothetical protein